jgi:hypothetical protein
LVRVDEEMSTEDYRTSTDSATAVTKELHAAKERKFGK